MSASTGTGWAQLRQQARSLESQTESLFHRYSQYASTSKLPQKPSEDEQRTEAQIQELFEKRDALVAQLSRLLDSESALTASALKQNNLSRHREVLTDHKRDLKRLRSSIAESRARQHLLSNVRSDIDAYHNNNNNSSSSNPNNKNKNGGGPADVEAEYMLQEHGHIDNSHSMMDSVLSQAYAVNESFSLQGESLASVNRRIVGAASQVPGINGLINRIGAKRRRDGIILGVFIAFCVLMLLYFR